MQTTYGLDALQKFIYAIEYEEFDRIDTATAAGQSRILDYFVRLQDFYISMYRNGAVPVRFHPEFFHLPNTEKFFSQVFASLGLSLCPQIDEVFQRCCAFVADYLGPSEAVLVMHRLMSILKERFPHLSEMNDKAIAAIKTEFFHPTIVEFLNQHESAVKHIQSDFPAIHELFVDPLYATPFGDRKLFNFYCNPWIYHPIAIYLASHECRSCLEIYREPSEKLLEILEERLQIIYSQTTEESWQELNQKAHKLLNHSANLEAFAIESAGLLGEISAAAHFIENNCHPKDILVFLPEKREDGKNCDLLIIRHETNGRELFECKSKSPRHGLDPKIAGDVQIWDDFFSNFTKAISSYIYYLQERAQPVLGLKLTKCFPLYSVFQGSNYGVPLPLIEDVLRHPTVCTTPLKDWSSEQKLTHLLHALFLRPLILDPCCVPLASDDARLVERQSSTKEALQKEWVNSLLTKATAQLMDAYQHQKNEGYLISKMYVALDLALSYRLLHDPFSDHDGNIREIVAQTLCEAFQKFKDDFAARNLDLELLIIQP